MDMTVMSAGPAQPHAGWAAVDELAALMAHYFDAEWLSPQPRPDHLIRRLSGRQRARYAPLAARGGDVLFVVARSPEDLAMVQAIANVRQRYQHIHAFITDSYFTAGYPAQTALFDSITVTAAEDRAHPMQRFGVRADHLHQGVDGLRWAPPERGLKRDIDLIAYGRTPASYHSLLLEHLHSASSPYLYLHSPLGNLRGPTVAQERGMLFKLLHRSHISLAFHLFVEPDLQRPRSMMVTSRWLESLLSGCLVAGRRPVSAMADEMLAWQGATIELSESPAQALDELLALLPERDAWRAQSRLNTQQTLLRHDWRWRLLRLCELRGWAVPAALTADSERVLARAEDFA